jgi:phosphatidylinositol alpha-1,6-mannosyltransferase
MSPLAWMVAGSRSRLTAFLYGIEAWRPLERMERWALSRADVLIAISEHTARRFREANPAFDARHIHVCHLAVADAPAYCPSPPRAAAPPTALIVGRMAAAERYKGHDLLLDLWPQILAQVPEAELIVVGEGDDRARLETRAAALRLRDRVHFLGGVSDSALEDLYRRCTFFVMPSRNEGFGLVFVEAMRAGRACIGGVGAAAEIIQDRVTGLVVDPQQPEHLLRGVLHLFQDPETRERMGRAAAERCAHLFTEQRFRERFRSALGLRPEIPLCAE